MIVIRFDTSSTNSFDVAGLAAVRHSHRYARSVAWLPWVLVSTS